LCFKKEKPNCRAHYIHQILFTVFVILLLQHRYLIIGFCRLFLNYTSPLRTELMNFSTSLAEMYPMNAAYFPWSQMIGFSSLIMILRNLHK